MKKNCLAILFALSSLAIAKTEFTGEKYLGKDIIKNLDVNDLEKGKIYEFFFETVENSLGNPRYIPVTVIKGVDKGKKFLINSGVHGNELNPILTTYKVKDNLNPKDVNGTITIVHAMNISGLSNNTRGFKYGGSSESTVDLNRQMNSGKTSTSAQQYSTIIWSNLLSKNADMVIDLHTSGRGGSFPLFAYADFRNSTVVDMAKLLNADVVKMDNGEKGTVETSFIELGIPSLTYELGNAETLQNKIVDRATTGILNNLVHFNFLDNAKIKKETETFYGNTWSRIKAEKGGYVENRVQLMDKVNKGDILFVQYDQFGNIVKEYASPNSGVVTSLKQYPYSEPGDSLGRVIEYNSIDKDQQL